MVMLVPLLLASPTGCSQPETGDPPKVEPGPKKREKKPDEPPKSPEPIVPPSLSGLNFPTEVSVAADGLLYFTEKSGALRVVRPGAAEPETILSVDVPDLAGYHETGLLGMALSPSFSEDGLVYLYHTYQHPTGLVNKVVRFDLDAVDSPGEVIVDRIPGGRTHNGGKLAFGPDGRLYVTTGDAGESALAQRRDSLGGKVLRVEPDGTVPEDNPFGRSLVYSMGHRNLFGLAISSGGRVFVTENGPDTGDEVNEVKPGGNYGWPAVLGGTADTRFEAPLISYEKVNAPTGVIFYEGALLREWQGRLVFGDWNEGDLHVLTLAGPAPSDEIRRSFDAGISAIAESPDGAVYVATENSIVRVDTVR